MGGEGGGGWSTLFDGGCSPRVYRVVEVFVCLEIF
jgi:hypothetical protein